jgi:hypothetical protein
MDAHVSSVVRATSFHLRNIGIVRKQLTNDATKLLVQSMVLSRHDYCNSCSVSKVCQKHHLTVCVKVEYTVLDHLTNIINI